MHRYTVTKYHHVYIVSCILDVCSSSLTDAVVETVEHILTLMLSMYSGNFLEQLQPYALLSLIQSGFLLYLLNIFLHSTL